MLKCGITTLALTRPIICTTSAVLHINKLNSSIAATQHVSNVRPYEDIPGPKALPIIGNSWRFLPYIGTYGGIDFLNVTKLLNNVYGNIVKITDLYGVNDMVILYEPQDFETVYRTEGPYPERNTLKSFKEYRTVLRKDYYKNVQGVGMAQGKQWHDLRSKFNPTLMQPRKMKMYVGPVDDIAKSLVSRMRDLRNEKGELPPNFSEYLHRWALEAVSMIALDTRLGCLDRDFSKTSDAQIMINVTHTFFDAIYELDFKPSVRHFTKKKEWKSLVDAHDKANEICLKYVKKAMERIEQKDSTDEQDLSVLETLLHKFDEPMIGVVMACDMMLAGIDTTANSASTALYYLARHQDKQEKLFQELKTILPSKDQTITAQNLEDMKYLRACIKESMRKSPTAALNMRTTVQDIVLGGYRVPKGTDIMLNHMIATSNEKHFPQADRYIPERWLKGIEDYGKANPFCFLPFGFGPRMCLGRRIAELEIETMVANVIRSFHLEYDQELKLKSAALNIVVNPLTFKLEDRP